MQEQVRRRLAARGALAALAAAVLIDGADIPFLHLLTEIDAEPLGDSQAETEAEAVR